MPPIPPLGPDDIFVPTIAVYAPASPVCPPATREVIAALERAALPGTRAELENFCARHRLHWLLLFADWDPDADVDEPEIHLDPIVVIAIFAQDWEAWQESGEETVQKAEELHRALGLPNRWQPVWTPNPSRDRPSAARQLARPLRELKQVLVARTRPDVGVLCVAARALTHVWQRRSD